MPTRKASARTGTTSITEAKRAMKKANRPAPMQPRLVYETIPARVVRLAPHVIHAGWGSGSQVTAHQNSLLPHASAFTILRNLAHFNSGTKNVPQARN